MKPCEQFNSYLATVLRKHDTLVNIGSQVSLLYGILGLPCVQWSHWEKDLQEECDVLIEIFRVFRNDKSKNIV